MSSGRIVVGIDGSPQATHALRWAAREAVTRDAVLEIVHAWRVPYARHPNARFVDAGIYKDRAVDTLDDAVASLASLEPAPTHVDAMLVEEDPATGLLTTADGARLLVVGSRGHGGFVGLLLGSVSQRCVDHGPCPVAVVPSTWNGSTHGRVVVGVDGSEPSYEALHWAIEEAARRGASLDVVNAYGFAQYVSPYGHAFASDVDELQRSSEALLRDMVDSAVGAARARPPTVEQIPTSMTAAHALLELAKYADLLVVGSRGKGGMRGMLTGSVSQQCVHHAPCPVVVVRPIPPGEADD